ncbi:hypothetical protein QQS21_011780 [Conoideocrella luteorostrata]|uniref:Ankyrin n=1 Tax=Conoideocrella luteorostrata TaxID=1105319 RepID=A0AAJ0CCQ9_9HYPO|nr:hypothetical protein QQS21_011780 [Conoideocrella luteorostrata]
MATTLPVEIWLDVLWYCHCRSEWANLLLTSKFFHDKLNTEFYWQYGHGAVFKAAIYGGMSQRLDAHIRRGGIRVNTEYAYGRRTTALLVAAEMGRLDVVEALLSAPNLDRAQVDSAEKTALMLAAEKGHVEMVKLLLPMSQFKQPINEYGNDRRRRQCQQRALTLAIQSADSQVAKLLANHTTHEIPPQKNSHQGLALESGGGGGGNEDMVKVALAKLSYHINIEDSSCSTALALAAEHGHHQIVQLLLSDPNILVYIRDYRGMTPFMRAALGGSAAVVEMLQPMVADINEVAQNGLSALHFAVASRESGALAYLLDAPNIDPNVRGSNGLTPLRMAVDYEDLDKVQMLIDKPDVDANPVDHRRHTPLSFAIQEHSYSIVRALVLSRRAHTNHRESLGRSALSQAIVAGAHGIVKFLLEQEGVVDMTTMESWL